MSKRDMPEILEALLEISKTQAMINTVQNEADIIVRQAIDDLDMKAYISELNSKQKKSFENIKNDFPHIANIIIKLNRKDYLENDDIKKLQIYTENDDDGLVVGKHIRITLLQNSILEYLSEKTEKKPSEIIRDALNEKIQNWNI